LAAIPGAPDDSGAAPPRKRAALPQGQDRWPSLASVSWPGYERRRSLRRWTRPDLNAW